ncbi:enoyl-CoA hydratase/isomerase family protein [Nocardia vaccinii]|uniref:enoyl-CoA hydratase/isomerase family protein n=1 Tax=Nocardia vaccinii TaxID=1822 RepID=UPI000830CABD|nr:enoyl-CoA hydratase-related protein [Nocardia vaccinii]
MCPAPSGVEVSTDARGVLTVTIDRPKAANSLTPQARDELTDIFQRASSTATVRAVLLRSTGDRHFCAGAALDATAAGPDTEHPVGDVARILQHGWQRLTAAILDCDKPVVVAVQGTAAGAGASLVLAADFVVMADSATLVQTFIRRGILPDAGAAYLLTRIVGLRRAAEMLMLGDKLTAGQCEQFGIVNRAVPAAEVTKVSDELAGRLAAGPTITLALTKKLLAVASESSRDRAFQQEAWAQELVSHTEDMHAGLAAFGRRAEPRFRGR